MRMASIADIQHGSSGGGAPVGVLVVDDQLVFRHVARMLIEATPDFVLLGEATSGEHALAALKELNPDLVLLDVRMPGMDGVETASLLHAAEPEPVVVLVSIEDMGHLPSRAASCGAAALIRKQDLSPAVLRRVWEAHGSGRSS